MVHFEKNILRGRELILLTISELFQVFLLIYNKILSIKILKSYFLFRKSNKFWFAAIKETKMTKQQKTQLGDIFLK